MKRVASIFILFSFCGYVNCETAKNGELRNCPKTVTVFMDKTAKYNFQAVGIDVGNVLELVNLNFKSQGVDISYDTKSLKIREWVFNSESLPPDDGSENFKIQILKIGQSEKKRTKDQSDIGIFLTGDFLGFGNGQASLLGYKLGPFSNHGNGEMLAGTFPTYP